MEPARGRLLLATPVLDDPNFDRTVILLLEHGIEGTLGVVLNRRGPVPVDAVVAPWIACATAPADIFLGGPVAPGGAIGLVRSPEPDEGRGFSPLFDGIGTVDLALDPADVGVEVDALRVFAGHAGWSPGQLDGELGAGAWFVVEAQPDDPWTDDPDTLWHRVLLRQPGRLRIFAHCPPDPSVN